jgi:hypothetical protein
MGAIAVGVLREGRTRENGVKAGRRGRGDEQLLVEIWARRAGRARSIEQNMRMGNLRIKGS